MSIAEKQVRQFLFEKAVEKDYCNIYSTYEQIEEALQKVVDDMFSKDVK